MKIGKIKIIGINDKEMASIDITQAIKISQFAGMKTVFDPDTGITARRPNNIKTTVIIIGPQPVIDRCLEVMDSVIINIINT